LKLSFDANFRLIFGPKLELLINTAEGALRNPCVHYVVICVLKKRYCISEVPVPVYIPALLMSKKEAPL
jgi:hypothetical protein